MNFVKLAAVSAMALVTSLSVSAQYRSVAVEMSDGTSSTVSLSNGMYTLFDKYFITFTDGSDEVFFTKSRVVSMSFSESAAIDGVGADSVEPVMSGDAISFSNLPAGTKINVFTTSGRCVSSECVSGEWTLSFASLVPDVYLINVNGVTYKIAVK